jgi:serine/threonine protein kinase
MLIEGHQLGRYTLEGKIGSGGMGTIFLAHDTQMDRAVAVKVVGTETPFNPGLDNASKLQRSFQREMKMTFSLSHSEQAPMHPAFLCNS